MRFLVLISLLFIYSSSFAQKDKVGVKRSYELFNNALIEKDSNTLNKVLHPLLSYGHSNAWVEEKDELIKHLFDGTITYNKVKTERIEVMLINKNLAIVRSDVLIDADFEGEKGLMFHLHVLQTWMWMDKVGWQLLNRQSVSIEK